MPTRKIRNPKTGEIEDTDVVEVIGEDNKPVMLRLADGAVLRLKVDVAEVARVPNAYNAGGEPLYLVKSSNSMALIEPPTDHAP